jgi:GNAT superfamily N-acetyltransferase
MPASEQHPPGGGPALEVVLAEDHHADALAAFIRQVWDQRATPESVLASRREGARQNVAEPGVPPPTWIALKSGRCLGYVTTIPIRLWVGKRDWPAYWIKGLMVLPEFRNGPIGHALMKAAAARLPRSAGLAAALPARRLFGALGYADLGAIPNWIRPVAAGRILQRLNLAELGLSNVPSWARGSLRIAQASGLAASLGWLGGLVLRGTAAALRLPGSALRAGPFDPELSAAELDALWKTARGAFPAGVVRDARYLGKRYPVGAAGPYVWVAAWNGENLAGVAILRRPRSDGDPRLRGIRVAALVDIVYPPDRPGTGLALLGAIERAAGDLDADAILASCSAPPLQHLLRRQCYLPVAGNVHLLFRDATAEGAAFGTEMTDWWLTRGDGNSDETF